MELITVCIVKTLESYAKVIDNPMHNKSDSYNNVHDFMLTGTSSCEDGDVRLVGGETEREGRVEMCYNGVWGSVCASGWDEVAANLVCSELGLETHHGEGAKESL